MTIDIGPDEESIKEKLDTLLQRVDQIQSELHRVQTEVTAQNNRYEATQEAIEELRDRFAGLSHEVNRIGRDSDMVAAHVAITQAGAKSGDFRATSKVPSPTQAAQNGFSFDDSKHRRPFGARYG